MVHHGPEGELVVALDIGTDVGPVLARPLVLKWKEKNIIWTPPLVNETFIFPSGVCELLKELIWRIFFKVTN